MTKKEYKGVNFVDNSKSPAGGLWLAGFIGSAIYFVGNVDGFWNIIVALLKAGVWPVFLINKVFELLQIQQQLFLCLRIAQAIRNTGTMEIQGELFDAEPYDLNFEYPWLKVLGVEIGQIHDVPSYLLHITPKPNTKLMEYGHDFSIIYTDEFIDDKDNRLYLSYSRSKPRPYSGYLQCVNRLDDNSNTPVLHVLPWITDMDMSVCIRLQDIEEISVYPDYAADLLAIYQDAMEDGCIIPRTLRLHGLPEDVRGEAEDLEPYMPGTYWWPEPSCIYSNEQRYS